MRIVVVGATGNVGTSVVRALSARPDIDEIIGIARRLPMTAEPKTGYETADIARDDLVPHFAGADAVFHLAWLFQPTHDPVATWQTNAVGSVRVFDAVAAAGVKTLLYASSVGAYSPGPDEVVDESWPTHSNPAAGYGREKAYVERALDAFEARHLDVRCVRFRPAFIFKRGAASAQRRLFAGPAMPNAIARPGLLPAVPLPAGLRFQAVHTRDVADAFVRALMRDVRGAFNIASEPVIDGPLLARVLGGRAIEVPRGVVRAVLASAWQLHLVPSEPALFDLFLQLPLLDCSRARTELEWMPAVSAIDAIAEALTGIAEGAG
ncbi:MAG TPA: NAD-dependent epimerase/dehydratase family protein, partial [Candidatus Tumulicola sp.]|nr:NAD-dependent epimerase/dehydratase family protein [Candidatus Tumulicola sp.]